TVSDNPRRNHHSHNFDAAIPLKNDIAKRGWAEAVIVVGRAVNMQRQGRLGPAVQRVLRELRLITAERLEAGIRRVARGTNNGHAADAKHPPDLGAGLPKKGVV